MGAVQVSAQKITVMIDNYKKKKLRNTLNITDRSRFCERDTTQIFKKIAKQIRDVENFLANKKYAVGLLRKENHIINSKLMRLNEILRVYVSFLHPLA